MTSDDENLHKEYEDLTKFIRSAHNMGYKNKLGAFSSYNCIIDNVEERISSIELKWQNDKTKFKLINNDV